MGHRNQVENAAENAVSMSLLARITAGSLDPAYLAHHEKGAPKSGFLTRLTVFLFCVLLAFATVIAIRHLHQDKEDSAQETRALVEAVEARQVQVSQLESETETLETALEGLRQTGSTAVSMGPGLLVASSLHRVSGPGLVVSVSEAVTTGSNPVVGDGELRTIVNALWAGGAEAVGVNGQRVGPQTNIRLAGSAILVNLKAVESPYTVEAIGDPDKLAEQMGTLSNTFKDKEGMSVSWKSSQHLILGPVGGSQTWFVAADEGGDD